MHDGFRLLSIREVARALGVPRRFAREHVGRRALASLRATRMDAPLATLRAFVPVVGDATDNDEAGCDGEA